MGPFNIAKPNMNVIEPNVKQRANLRGRSANIGSPTKTPRRKNTEESIRLPIKILNLVEYDRPNTVFGWVDSRSWLVVFLSDV